jgi:hypothetical protein
VLEFAPVRDGHGKAFIESLIGAVKNRFEHRLTITTKGSPEDRGLHDPDRPAIRAAIDPDLAEEAMSRFFTDVYSRAWHGGLRERPFAAWDEARERFGVRRWAGSTAELRMLLKRSEGTREVVLGKGISYRGRWYGGDFLRTHIRDKVVIKVDEDDLRTVDVYTAAGVLLGVAKHGPFSELGRPVSRWELDLADELDRVLQRDANAEALGNQHDIIRDLYRHEPGQRDKAAGRKRHHRQRAEETTTFETDLANLLGDGMASSAHAGGTLPAPVPDLATEFDSLPIDEEVPDDDAA